MPETLAGIAPPHPASRTDQELHGEVDVLLAGGVPGSLDQVTDFRGLARGAVVEDTFQPRQPRPVPVPEGQPGDLRLDLLHLAEPAQLVAELGGAEQPGGLCLRIRTQRGRSLQARGGSGDRTAALRVAGRAFQLGRDLLVPSGDRGGPVPHRAVGLIGQDTCERRVRPPAGGGRHGLPEGRTDQRVRDAVPLADCRQQPVFENRLCHDTVEGRTMQDLRGREDIV